MLVKMMEKMKGLKVNTEQYIDVITRRNYVNHININNILITVVAYCRDFIDPYEKKDERGIIFVNISNGIIYYYERDPNEYLPMPFFNEIVNMYHKYDTEKEIPVIVINPYSYTFFSQICILPWIK